MNVRQKIFSVLALPLLIVAGALAQQGGGIQGGQGGGGFTTGSFTAGMTGCNSGTVNQKWNYALSSGVVVLTLVDDVQCGVSNSTSWSSGATDVPVAIRPNVDVTLIGLAAVNNGAVASACVTITSTGQLQGRVALAGGAGALQCNNTASWTAANGKGIRGPNGSGATNFVYAINNL